MDNQLIQPTRCRARLMRVLGLETMKTYYCWQCKREMPFLEEGEFAQIASLLSDVMQAIK